MFKKVANHLMHEKLSFNFYCMALEAFADGLFRSYN